MVSTEPLGPFVEPISGAIVVLIAGVLAGGIGFLLMYVAKSTAISKESSLGREFNPSA